MVGPILFFLFIIALAGWVLVFTGVRFMAIATDIQSTQAQVLAVLQALAAQQASTISAADAAAILANEQTNLAAAQALIVP